jgi:hypothetical protein
MNIGIPNDYLVGGFKHVFSIIYIYISIYINIWDNPSHWLIFFQMVKTTNQLWCFSQIRISSTKWAGAGANSSLNSPWTYSVGLPTCDLGIPWFSSVFLWENGGKMAEIPYIPWYMRLYDGFYDDHFSQNWCLFFSERSFFSTRLGIEEYPGLMGFLP